MDIPLTPAPPEMKSPVAPATATDPAAQTGSWSICDAIGRREGVLDAIAKHGQMKPHWKAALTADLNEFPAEFNHFELDAHYQRQGTRMNLHYTLSAFKAL